MNKTALTLLALFASPLVWATGFCPDTPALVVEPISIPRIASQQEPDYQDILNRCTTLIGDLERSQMRANSVARTGNLNHAADILAQALADKANRLPPNDVYSFNPHTVEAIRNGDKIVQKLFASSSSARGLPRQLVGQVRFAVTSEVYHVIKMAYRELDERYYMSTMRTCRYGCEPWNQFGISSEYYDGVRKLAKSFLDLQIHTAQIQASDTIELAVSGEVAGASKNILLGSVFRRDYSCAISALHNLEWDIRNAQCSDPGYPTPWFVEEVRSRIQSIDFSLQRCRW